jgi:hypothetical protein
VRVLARARAGLEPKTLGAGVTFIEHINVNIEYEKMDIDEVDDAYVLWLTSAWRL